jgi:hypothetical protein
MIMGVDKSTIKRFILEYFLSATPIELTRYTGKGGVANGPNKYPLSTTISMHV